jgi:hypothetical protein
VPCLSTSSASATSAQFIAPLFSKHRQQYCEGYLRHNSSSWNPHLRHNSSIQGYHPLALQQYTGVPTPVAQQQHSEGYPLLCRNPYPLAQQQCSEGSSILVSYKPGLWCSLLLFPLLPAIHSGCINICAVTDYNSDNSDNSDIRVLPCALLAFNHPWAA